MLLVGWTGLLVPSLIRSIEPAFEQTDAGIGVFFFVVAAASVGGSMAGGLLTERIGRRVVLPFAVALIALGLTQEEAAAIRGFFVSELPAVKTALQASFFLRSLVGMGV